MSNNELSWWTEHNELVIKKVPRINQSKVVTKTFELKVTMPIEFQDSDGEIVAEHQVDELVQNELAWQESRIGEFLAEELRNTYGCDGLDSFIDLQINEVA